MDNTPVVFTIDLSQAKLAPDKESFHAQVRFTMDVAGGYEGHVVHGTGRLPMIDRYGGLDDSRIYANLLTQGLFSSEAARRSFDRFERIRYEKGRPGHIIVQFPRADSQLLTAEWELLRHPKHPEQPLVSLSCPLIRRCDIIDREPELQAPPNLAQLKLAVTSSNLDDQLSSFSASWGKFSLQVESLELSRAMLGRQQLASFALILQPRLALGSLRQSDSGCGILAAVTIIRRRDGTVRTDGRRICPD